jgi:hypothetical protein
VDTIGGYADSLYISWHSIKSGDPPTEAGPRTPSRSLFTPRTPRTKFVTTVDVWEMAPKLY